MSKPAWSSARDTPASGAVVARQAPRRRPSRTPPGPMFRSRPTPSHVRHRLSTDVEIVVLYEACFDVLPKFMFVPGEGLAGKQAEELELAREAARAACAPEIDPFGRCTCSAPAQDCVRQRVGYNLPRDNSLSHAYAQCDQPARVGL